MIWKQNGKRKISWITSKKSRILDKLAPHILENHVQMKRREEEEKNTFSIASMTESHHHNWILSWATSNPFAFYLILFWKFSTCLDINALHNSGITLSFENWRNKNDVPHLNLLKFLIVWRCSVYVHWAFVRISFINVFISIRIIYIIRSFVNIFSTFLLAWRAFALNSHFFFSIRLIQPLHWKEKKFFLCFFPNSCH